MGKMIELGVDPAVAARLYSLASASDQKAEGETQGEV
jgi:hypothetical protein